MRRVDRTPPHLTFAPEEPLADHATIDDDTNARRVDATCSDLHHQIAHVTIDVPEVKDAPVADNKTNALNAIKPEKAQPEEPQKRKITARQTSPHSLDLNGRGRDHARADDLVNTLE